MWEVNDLVETLVPPELLLGVWLEKRWVRGVVEKVEDDGWDGMHGVDHLCYMKVDQLSTLTHLPEVSLLVSTQCTYDEKSTIITIKIVIPPKEEIL